MAKRDQWWTSRTS